MPLETHDDILDPSKSPEDHYGPAIAALEKLVSEIMAEPSYRVACHAWYSPAHGIRVAELSIVVDAQGSGMSWMRSVPDNMDMIMACEQYLLAHGTPAFRPDGWKTEIDEVADAEFALRCLLRGGAA